MQPFLPTPEPDDWEASATKMVSGTAMASKANKIRIRIWNPHEQLRDRDRSLGDYCTAGRLIPACLHIVHIARTKNAMVTVAVSATTQPRTTPDGSRSVSRAAR